MKLRVDSAAGRWALLASILGSGMAFLDGTAVNLALPAIGDDLGTGFAGFQWVVNGYLLMFGALVLIGGSLGDRFGRRRVFEAGVIAFALASFACGLAPGTATLILFRLVQGAAAALLVPTSLALIHGVFAEEDRGRAIGAWSGFSGLSTIVGPLLGGWLIDAVSWRAIFLLNPVVAALTLVVTRRHVPPGASGVAAPIDVPGAVTAAAGLGGLVFALIEGPERGWTPPVIAAGALGAALLVAFLIIEARASHPMLPLGFFRRRAFAGANATTFVVYAALGGVFFLLSLQLQRVLGYSPFEAGLATAPVTILLFVLSPLAGGIADRIGPRLPMTIGPLVAAVGTALLARVTPGSGYIGAVLPGIAVFGVGLGITVAPLTSAALSALPDEHSGTASGVNNAVARIAQLLAVVLLPLAAGLSGIEAARGPAFSAGFGQAMWMAAGTIAAGAVVAWFTVPARD